MPGLDPVAFSKDFAHRRVVVHDTELHYVEGGRGAMQSGFEYYRAIFDSIAQNRETAAKKLSMPVFAIGGAQWLGPLMQKMVEPVSANLRTEVIAGSGHFVPEEAPEAVIRLLQAFLK